MTRGSQHTTRRSCRSCGSRRCGWSSRWHRAYDSQWAAIDAVAQKLRVGTAETVRKWVRRAEGDAGHRLGTTSEESVELNGSSARLPSCAGPTKSSCGFLVLNLISASPEMIMMEVLAGEAGSSHDPVGDGGDPDLHLESPHPLPELGTPPATTRVRPSNATREQDRCSAAPADPQPASTSASNVTASLPIGPSNTVPASGALRCSGTVIRRTVVLDPGHGGVQTVGGSSAFGAIGPNGLLEKQVNLDVVTRTARKLRSHARVLLTRTQDVNLSLTERSLLAQRIAADVFLSIHANAWPDTHMNGSEAWVARCATPASHHLAESVLASVLHVTKLPDLGVKEADLGVLLRDRHHPRTAAALVEVSFLSHPAEAFRLADPTYRDSIAKAVASGITTYLGTLDA